MQGTEQLSNLARAGSWVAAVTVPAAFMVTNIIILMLILIIPWQSSHRSLKSSQHYEVGTSFSFPFCRRGNQATGRCRGWLRTARSLNTPVGMDCLCEVSLRAAIWLGWKQTEQRVSEGRQVAHAFALICDLPPGQNVAVIVYWVATENREVKATGICMATCEQGMLAWEGGTVSPGWAVKCTG